MKSPIELLEFNGSLYRTIQYATNVVLFMCIHELMIQKVKMKDRMSCETPLTCCF